MNLVRTIGPFDPQMPHDQFKMPVRPKSFLEERINEVVKTCSPFLTLYDAFEEQVEYWNFLAEHPLYLDAKCLKEYAHDSLRRYAALEKTRLDLKNCCRMPGDKKALLQDVYRTMTSIRSTFETCVLPALKEKLEEGGQECVNAAKALSKKPSLPIVQDGDAAACLIEDYGRLQYALGRMGHQVQMIKEAMLPLLCANKGVYMCLKKLLVKASISSKNSENVQKLFLNRMKALTEVERSIFEQKLQAMLQHHDPLVAQEGRALFCSVQEMKVPAKAKAYKLYQKIVKKQYSQAVQDAHRIWENQETLVVQQLESGISPVNQKLLGFFFLLLQASAWLQGIKRQADYTALVKKDSLQTDGVTLASLVRFGKSNLLPLFVRKGVSLDAIDQNGMTAFHWASLLGLSDAAAFLQARGADVHMPNRFGMRPADLYSQSIVNEKRLKADWKIKSGQLKMKHLPKEIRIKLRNEHVKTGVSASSIVHMLAIPKNTSILLDSSVADLVIPLGVSKKDCELRLKNSVVPYTGALRQRLGAVTGSYLDALLKKHPVSEIAGFFVPATIIRSQSGIDFSTAATPLSITRFVPSSKDMVDVDVKEIPQGELVKLLVLDVILGNTDRHLKNALVQTTVSAKGKEIKRIIPIDHDLILPNLEETEYKWDYAFLPISFSEEWKAFILGLDADALWKMYEKEAALFKASFSFYIKGKTGIDDDTYLNFQARIKVLQEGALRNWPQDRIARLFFHDLKTEARPACEQFFTGDHPELNRKERLAHVFENLMDYFIKNE